MRTHTTLAMLIAAVSADSGLLFSEQFNNGPTTEKKFKPAKEVVYGDAGEANLYAETKSETTDGVKHFTPQQEEVYEESPRFLQ